MSNKTVILEWNQKHTLNEWIAMDDAITLGAKAANEQYRINKILEAYPTAQDLANELKSTNNSKALALADKLEAMGNDPQAYYRMVRILSGRTFLHYLGNLIGGPFAMIYQGIQGIKNFGGRPSGKQLVYDRL